MLAATLLLAFPLRTAGSAPPAVERIDHVLGISGVGRSGRAALHTDAIELALVTGTFHAPKAGDEVKVAGRPNAVWVPVDADKNGAFHGPAFEGGYAAAVVRSESDRTALLEAGGDTMVYVNGEPRGGDPYDSGWMPLAIRLHKGDNLLLFSCGRGSLHADIRSAPPGVSLLPIDMTLPDALQGDNAAQYAGVVVMNASGRDVSTGTVSAIVGAGTTPRATTLPLIPAMSMRKVVVPLGALGALQGASVPVTFTLTAAGSRSTVDGSLRVRAPGQTYKHTFISAIDGSAQYYAVTPCSSTGDNHALVLSLHGAGVEAIGQADSYESKPWTDIVCPTNRRPFGFDWEDWGRDDAMEVLANATERLHPDPSRIYLTGHSMGGHGTWSIGSTLPGTFAAIAPSAGWISFQSYVGRGGAPASGRAQEIVRRASASSDTLEMKYNLAQDGVYILHGTKDDNVPISEAETMASELAKFHHDYTFYRKEGVGHWWDDSDEPGASCVDWPGIFDMFARHRIPANDAVRDVDFTTVNPGVSASDRWAEIIQQQHECQPSRVQLRYDPGVRRVSGTTSNVRVLALHSPVASTAGKLAVVIDGETLSASTGAGPVVLVRSDDGTWRQGAAPAPAEKNPARYGPFKAGFDHGVILVYGTSGTPAERNWARARARFDSEQWQYRGNGAVDCVSDREYLRAFAADANRSVVLYGDRGTNAAWSLLMAGSPVDITPGRMVVGGRTVSGDDLGAIILRPRAGSAVASVLAIGGTGLAGARLTERIPMFISGAGLPDFLVMRPSVLAGAPDGVVAAGFFAPDWSLSGTDYVGP